MTADLNAALDDALGTEAPAPPRVGRPGPPPVAATGLVRVAVADLTPSTANPRESLPDIEELAASIREHGLIQPIVARRTPTGLVIVAGHRRHAALQRLGHLTCEVIVRKDIAPDAELAQMLVENGQRAGLDPIEEARALARLQAIGGLSSYELAKKVGRSQVTVSARLALLALPVEEQEALRAGDGTIGAAVQKARLTAGTVRRKGFTGSWHLGPEHPLARNARGRCEQQGHPRGRRVGGTACGSCWESVIRADERQHLHKRSALTGQCVLCGAPDTTVDRS